MSLYEMARLMVHCEVTHWLSVEVVNQWSELGSNPLPEGIEKVGDAWGIGRGALMKTVSLPNGPDESLKQAVRFLSSWIAPPDYRLGGGTALAVVARGV